MTSLNIVFLFSSFHLTAFSLLLILAASFSLFFLSLSFFSYLFSFYLLFLLSSPNYLLFHIVLSKLVRRMYPMLFLLLYLRTVVLPSCLGAVLVCLVSLL